MTTEQPDEQERRHARRRSQAPAKVHGLLEIMRTVDSRDSLGADWAQIEHNVIEGLRPGSSQRAATVER